MDTISILALPEEVMRYIFDYLSDAEVYFNLRCVCRHLWELAESYVQVGKQFNILLYFLARYMF